VSRDFQIAFACPHVLGEERVALQADRRTLLTEKPVGGVGLLRVQANDTLELSPGGVHSTARLVSLLNEPYRFTALERELVIRTATTRTAVAFTVGYWKAADVVALLNGRGGAYTARVEPPGRLVLEAQRVAHGVPQILVEGSARDALGWGRNWGSIGREIYPGWDVITDATRATRVGVRFHRPIRTNPYFSITYTVPPTYCLRCRGTEVENDYRFDEAGVPRSVENENLLYQACLKILLTELRSNLYYPWYGTTLAAQIGTKSAPGAEASLQQTVQVALQSLQSLQTAQARYQPVSPKERLYAVDAVEVKPLGRDPTVYSIYVAVRNYASEPVVLTLVYTTPGTFALPGTNGLSLGNYG
jgi:hypothetical protein